MHCHPTSMTRCGGLILPRAGKDVGRHLAAAKRLILIRAPPVKREQMTELDQYDYELPKHLIAQSPAVCRSDARLLVVDRADGSLEHKHIRDLPEILRPDDCLVINDTRVVPARLVGRRTRRAATGKGCSGMASRRALAGDVQDPGQAQAGRDDHADQRRRPRRHPARTGAPSSPTGVGSPGRCRRRRPSPCWTAWAACRCRPTSARARWSRRPRALPDGLRPGARARWPRRPPACTSPSRCCDRLDDAGRDDLPG